MKKYMSYCSQYLCHKNKLQEAFKKFIKSIDRQIIDFDDIEKYKDMIIEESKKLSAQYPRCKPLDITFWSPRAYGLKNPEDGDIILDDDGLHIVSFTLLFGESVVMEKQ